MTAAEGLADLAALALAEVLAHAPRTPERRAASALYVALSDAGTVAAVRRSLASFAAPETAAAALELLGRLAAELDVPAGNPAGGAAPTSRSSS